MAKRGIASKTCICIDWDKEFVNCFRRESTRSVNLSQNTGSNFKTPGQKRSWAGAMPFTYNTPANASSVLLYLFIGVVPCFLDPVEEVSDFHSLKKKAKAHPIPIQSRTSQKV